MYRRLQNISSSSESLLDVSPRLLEKSIENLATRKTCANQTTIVLNNSLSAINICSSRSIYSKDRPDNKSKLNQTWHNTYVPFDEPSLPSIPISSSLIDLKPFHDISPTNSKAPSKSTSIKTIENSLCDSVNDAKSFSNRCCRKGLG